MSSTATHNTFKAPCNWRSSTPGPTLHGNDYSCTSSQDHVVGPIVEGSSTSSGSSPGTSTSLLRHSTSTTEWQSIIFVLSKRTTSSLPPANATDDCTFSPQNLKLTCTSSTRYGTRYSHKVLR